MRCFLAHRFCVVCLALASWGAVSQADERRPIDVVLLGGQSNASGAASADQDGVLAAAGLRKPQDDILYLFRNVYRPNAKWTTLRPFSAGDRGELFGPEITFGRSVRNADPQTEIAILKASRGGSDLARDWHLKTGDDYARFREAVVFGLQRLRERGYKPRITAMLWTQGESDSANDEMTDAYEKNLTAFIADIRSYYGENLPFLISRLSEHQVPKGTTKQDRFRRIQAAQTRVADRDPNTYSFSTSDLSLKEGEAIHFDARGLAELGRRFARLYLQVNE